MKLIRSKLSGLVLLPKVVGERAGRLLPLIPTNCANCGTKLNSPRCESCGYWNPGN